VIPVEAGMPTMTFCVVIGEVVRDGVAVDDVGGADLVLEVCAEAVGALPRGRTTDGSAHGSVDSQRVRLRVTAPAVHAAPAAARSHMMPFVVRTAAHQRRWKRLLPCLLPLPPLVATIGHDSDFSHNPSGSEFEPLHP
jgi:hypothetical protein